MVGVAAQSTPSLETYAPLITSPMVFPLPLQKPTFSLEEPENNARRLIQSYPTPMAEWEDLGKRLEVVLYALAEL